MRWLLAYLFAVIPGSLVAQMAKRDFTDPAVGGWKLSPWNKAEAQILDGDRAPKAEYAMREFKVGYRGNGFAYASITPVAGNIPGKVKSVKIIFREEGNGSGWKLTFADPNADKKKKGPKMEFGLSGKPGEWTEKTFKIPANWPQPLKLAGISAHNWNRKNDVFDSTLSFYGLEVETDLTHVADRKSLVSVSVESGAERNIFLQGKAVVYKIRANSWLADPVKAKLKWSVVDTNGKQLAGEEKNLRLKGVQERQVRYTPPALGPYRMRLSLKTETGVDIKEDSRFVYIQAPLKLTKEEKRYSPHGINIHGGQPGVSYKGIARLGFVWVRDYAYNYDWMTRARGENGKYEGWPWYQKMDKAVKESGVMLLPCTVGWLSKGRKEGLSKPGKAHRRDLFNILMAFDYPAWEMDNEYDLHHRKEEEEENWKLYDKFHKSFGDVVQFADEDLWAVEQGTAGVHPDRVRRSVLNGSFDNIDVCNAHFYCGIVPPELSTRNANTGGERLAPRLVFDNLREFTAAADADGKNRQAWITEFGWDTLAGHIVTEHQQSAYLQRGYMLGFAAGMDKMFWYWNRDTKQKPNNFFDGCGIFDPKDEPKPVCASASALFNRLKKPEYVGSFDLDGDSMGHVFRDRGRLVAAAFKLRPDSAGSSFNAKGKLFDMYGNSVSGPVKLDVAPTWVDGVAEDDPIVLETAYDLESRYFDLVTAGDEFTVKLRVTNKRKSAINARWQVALPTGWSAAMSGGSISVAAGKNRVVPVAVRIAATELSGERQVVVKVTEGTITKTLVTRLRIVPAVDIKVGRLPGKPGKSPFTVSVRNNAKRAMTFKLESQLPSGWKSDPGSMTKKVAPEQLVDFELQLDWKDRWSPADQAVVKILGENGHVINSAGIVPGALRLPKADIKLDGKLSDWPKEAWLPDWAFPTTDIGASAKIAFAWHNEGLLVGVEVHGTKGDVTDPKWFWAQNCLELFIASKLDSDARKEYLTTDHQLWFCPILKDGSVYGGRWARRKGDKTQYDIPIKGKSSRTADGYVMEFLLPASTVKGLGVGKGKQFGLNANLTVIREGNKPEFFWPVRKGDGAANKPHEWGNVTMD